MSSSEFAIRADRLGKVYRLYDRPVDRLKQMLSRGRRRYGREFHALDDVSFELKRGEVLGLVGRNGAGKSTLLQLICGTLTPSTGSVVVNGRIAALLELGAGFNPDFSGRENVYLNASVLGLSREEIDARYDAIVAFSGIGEFIHQPVRTYSSGMYVRLAFAIATSVDPEILVVDEALSVGDGEFARKSFDRIMQLKDGGATILFCSHSMYQIESICDQVAWLEQGRLRLLGHPAHVVTAYQAALAEVGDAVVRGANAPPRGHARFGMITLACDGDEGAHLKARSGASDLIARVRFSSDPSLPPPAVAVTFDNAELRLVASAISLETGEVARDADGNGEVSIRFPALPLLKGRYSLSFYLTCERGLHFYDAAPHQHTVDVEQASHEQGIFHIPRQWVLDGKAA